MKKIVMLVVLSFAAVLLPLRAAAIELHWDYNRFYHDQILGYRIYMGTSPDKIDQKIADLPKSNLTIVKELPILIEEHFDQDPGSKYPLQSGTWSWNKDTKNMHIDSASQFMIVFEKAAGMVNDMGFTFQPEKNTSDQPALYSYIKDEAASTNGGVYYELRLAGSNGTRYSNWRKVYDQKYGGIDSGGAYPLPRYPQCNIAENQNNLCPGFRVLMSWRPETYAVSIKSNENDLPIMNASVSLDDVDKRALNINKLEIIISNQSGWIDDIIIGGNMEIGTEINLTMPQIPVYFAASAYYQDPKDSTRILETDKSISLKYENEIDVKEKPLPIKNMRKAL